MPIYDKSGVIEEGAYADILLIHGNPLEDISDEAIRCPITCSMVSRSLIRFMWRRCRLGGIG